MSGDDDVSVHLDDGAVIPDGAPVLTFVVSPYETVDGALATAAERAVEGYGDGVRRRGYMYDRDRLIAWYYLDRCPPDPGVLRSSGRREPAERGDTP